MLILALHHIFSDLCSGYAQCHHVRIYMFSLANKSHNWLKFLLFDGMKENVDIRLSGFKFQINETLFFLLLNQLHKVLINAYSCCWIYSIHHIDSIISSAFKGLTDQIIFGVQASRLSALFCREKSWILTSFTVHHQSISGFNDLI